MIKCTFENGKETSLRHTVVHAIVVKNDEILLVKRAEHLLEGGKWSLPSGFVDRDETISQAVEREVLEETGFKTKVVTIFRINSNPNRPGEDRQNIAFDFILDCFDNIGHRDDESSEIGWFSINDVNTNTLAFDHGESLEMYKSYRLNKFKLPIFEK